MAECHSEVCAYIGCADTDRLVSELTTLCEAEGMRRVEAAPTVLVDAPSGQHKRWSIAVLPGAPGWHVLLAMPLDFFCERAPSAQDNRFAMLCRALKAPGLLREVHEGLGSRDRYGSVTQEIDAAGQQALSGAIWREEDPPDAAQPSRWHGYQLDDEKATAPSGLRLIEPILPTQWTTDTEAMRSDVAAARLCGHFAQRLGGPSSSRFWRAESAWALVHKALILGGPMPVPGGVMLTFEWPALAGPWRESAAPPTHLDGRDGRKPHCQYGDGQHMATGDELQVELGRRGTVTGFIMVNAAEGPALAGVVVEDIAGSWLIEPPGFRHMRLIKRAAPLPGGPPSPELLTKAAAGDPEALCVLAGIHARGDGVVQNELRAHALFAQAAQRGHAQAQYGLGMSFYRGDGMPVDWPQAAHWMRQAAGQGHVPAMWWLARHHLTGLAVDKDSTAALAWLERAAQAGDASSQYQVACWHAQGTQTPKDLAKAAHWFHQAAEQGDVESQNRLAECHDEGWGVARNEAVSAAWYIRASENGHADAQCMIGYWYAIGKGVHADQKQALAWWEKSAAQGHVQAAKNLALSRPLAHNDSPPPGTQAEEPGGPRDAQGQYRLGQRHETGAEGVAIDLHKAAHWYAQAAAQGHLDALHDLALLRLTGTGGPANAKAAFELLRQAANRGHALAQFELGQLYANGEGTRADMNMARVWYRKSAEQGHALAQQALQGKPWWRFW